MNVHDQHLRDKALNPRHSFIVQAPAGSGKTELLTQRFLNLLIFVKKPEEIVAITFTRKAAAEMRQRIIRALLKTRLAEASLAPHEIMTRGLAEQALEKDRQYGWNLIENPNRLRILTIDALSGSICAQTPLLSQLGGQPKITEDAYYFYQLAAREFLTDASHPPELTQKIEVLLLHLDNRVYQLQALLTHILSKREQWLSHIMHFNQSPELLRKHLEQALCAVFQEKVEQAEAIFSTELKTKIIQLLAFSQSSKGSDTKPLFQSSSLDRFMQWQAMANLLLTQAGAFRKTVNKNLGFPAKHPMKIEMENLLESLSENESLRHALHEIGQCPPTQYRESQWEILEALLVVLPRLTAQLQLIFAEHASVDFVELSLRADFALGTEESPTDLALYLDHRIQHLLIDEFQDTSITQFSLIEKLMSGWVPGDGRSVFLVGDPMQSIYRFREANVGLFLRAKTQGIAGIPLQFIPLSTNFRSDARLVDWFNTYFPNLFPRYSDITTGAVPYSPALAAKSETENAGVFFYPRDDENEEAEQVASLIQQLQKKNPLESIAILVRSRPQLREILPSLARQGIQYHALEIESLGDRPEIQDLLSLTRALLHLADRLSWLALLRSPFCGLKLADLHLLAQTSHPCIWDAMLSDKGTPLSADGQERLQRIVPILHYSLEQKGRLPLAQWVEGTWRALSGPLVLSEKSEHENADVFFQTLVKLDQAHQGLPLKQLGEAIQKMSATPKTPGNHPIQVMTIHKSKGLEFDHVILPGLSKTAAQDQNQLLLWLERAHSMGGSDLLLAPIKSALDESDPIYAYLRKVEKKKADHELIRLLYVGLTRAKISAHAIAQVEINEKNPEEFVKPSKGSFLGLLWEAFSEDLQHDKKNRAPLPEENIQTPRFMRIINSLALRPCHPEQSEGSPRPSSVPPAFKQNISAIVGTLVHLALEKLAQGKKMPDAFFKNQAMLQGLPSTEFDFALAQIHRAIENCLSDERGQWILKPRDSAQSEISISTYKDDEIIPLVIDRTFLDEKGTRWIIDYKTSVPINESLEEFLNKEASRYLEKLAQYTQAFAKMDPRPIRVALYFPMIPHYFEIEELSLCHMIFQID